MQSATGYKTLPTTFIPVKNFSKNGTDMSVNPQLYYSSEPAPMGIADYGLSTNGITGYNSYSYSTPSFLGKVNITSLSTNNTTSFSVEDRMSFQMNVNLEFYDAVSEYDYWIQDVALVQTSSPQSILFIDNVWNYSSGSAEMHNSSISGNGTVAKSGSTGYYYAIANSTLPGNNMNFVYPMKLQLKVLSTINSNGKPEVAFLYNDGYGWVTFDNATFIFANHVTSDLGFVVNGSEYNPFGAYYDAELILGGPGGGTDTNDTSSNLSLKLQYWNGHNYQQISNAFNHGSDTAEGISNIISSGEFSKVSGSVLAMETPGSSSLGQIYSYKDVGILNLSTTLRSGILSVGGRRHDFQNYGANLTLGPGNYSIALYNSTNPDIPVWDSTANISAGSYTALAAYGFYAVTFSESGLPQGSGWYVNITGMGSSGKITAGDYIVYLQNGTYYYNVSTGLKTYRSSYASKLDVSGSDATQYVVFRELKYNIEFSETGLPVGTVWNISSYQNISASTSGSNLTLHVTDGTYYFYVSTSSPYYPLQKIYNITVSGSNLTENLTFKQYSYISGTITPADSTLKIDGKAVNVTDGKFSLKAINGTYSVVASLHNYNNYYTNISVNSGSHYYLNISLNLSLNPRTVKAQPPSADYYFIGALSAIVAVFALVALISRRRR
ncbi:thermopsin [Oxyplasma meridianum]|uniref:Thermopsin n=1 Tax=Oxyplasma meridianum TaxID=3073602 RepID=A0AAX4NHQ0_9ARCH